MKTSKLIQTLLVLCSIGFAGGTPGLLWDVDHCFDVIDSAYAGNDSLAKEWRAAFQEYKSDTKHANVVRIYRDSLVTSNGVTIESWRTSLLPGAKKLDVEWFSCEFATDTTYFDNLFTYAEKHWGLSKDEVRQMKAKSRISVR